ncbi:hypothetical protein [Algoriphagus hitonicola]|uniref:Uncharacterized protein n=1 Tax=Algoriphagus hitonicola TaxID=435880 RepID=A0A1I2WMR0_9BACT|nr:hypothetical protein [Algoriphagus hitonicola]SFH02593.1 hypothetical protein SAMN04487988_11392 [Algoriphagus hitonicola]
MSYSSDRREFFKKLAFFGLVSSTGGWLASCDDAELQPENLEGGVFQVWREMQQLIQTSPDCLIKAYERVKESKDPKEMLAFVRDSIFLIPANEASLRGMGNAMRGGVRGVLRDGFATPREKAELLRQLLEESGIQAAVVFERTDFDEEKVNSLFFRPRENEILADLNEGQYERWMKMLELSETDLQELTFINSEEKEAEKLANQLWELIPEKEQIRFHDFDFRWDNSRCPAVQFQWENKTLIAHLFDPNVPFGEAFDSGGRVRSADPAEYILDQVEFSLSYRDNIQPTEEKILLTKNYEAKDLIGRQVHLGFYHGLDWEEQASTTFKQVRVFTPALSIERPDLSEEEKEGLAQLGETITLEGQKIEVDEKAKIIRVNGFPINWTEESTRAKDVSELKLKITAGLPSLVKMEVWPTDQEGNLVEGLMASDFTFWENDLPLNPLMESNETAPKVLILYDTSLSMPVEYRNEGMEAFLEKLEEGIRQDFPKASVTSWATDSSLYQWLRKASRTSFDLILFATDGDNKDDLKDGDLDAFRAGPPVIVLDVFNSTRASSREVFENLSVSSEGNIINAQDQSVAQQEILEQLSLLELPPYVFTFYGSLQSESNEIKVSLDSDRVNASEIYQFKYREESQSIGPKIIGIYLKIKIGNQTTERVLAGWDPAVEEEGQIGKNHADEVRNLLFGSVIIGVEGQGPTFANALNELLEFRLSNQSWIEAIKAENLDQAIEAVEKSNWIYDPLMIHLLAPLPDQVREDSLTFASGIRMVIVKRSTGINQEFSEDSVDILPTANFVTISEDLEKSFRLNLKKTAHLALVEGAFFEESTLSLLGNADLISTEEAKNEVWFEEQLRDGPYANFIREYWSRAGSEVKIFGKELDTLAYWQIDKKTGELLGILPDQTGGGKRKVFTQYEDLNDVMKAYSRTLSFTSMGGFRFIGFHVALIRLYAIASHAIKTMDTRNLEQDVLNALQMRACDAAWYIHSGLSGRPQKIMGGLAKLISMMDKTSDDFPCE